MPYLFTSPTAPGVRPRDDGTNAARLMRHITPPPRGRHVIKEAGTWKTVDEITTQRVAAAQEVLYGGHESYVSASLAAELAAAGYDVYSLFSDLYGVTRGTQMDGLTDPYGATWLAAGIFDPDPSTQGDQSSDDTFKPYVDSGRIRTPETTVDGAACAGYAWTYLPDAPSRGGSWMVFAEGDPGFSGTANIWSAVESTDPAEVAAQSVHVVTNSLVCGIYLLNNDTPPFTPVDYHYFDEPLVCDDVTRHLTDASVDGTVCTVTCPDGFELVVDDPEVASLWGSTFMVEQLWGPGYGGAEPMTVNPYAVV